MKGYDYSREGAYFITICCKDRACKFGRIEDDRMVLNEYGAIAYREWSALPTRFSNMELDVFQIMPNHMHAIILLTTVGAGFTPAQDNTGQSEGTGFTAVRDNMGMGDDNPGRPQGIAPTVGGIVGAYKSLVTNGCLEVFKQKWEGATDNPHMGKVWQRNYHDHIIRNDEAYERISAYIINNPAKWKEDKFHTP